MNGTFLAAGAPAATTVASRQTISRPGTKGGGAVGGEPARQRPKPGRLGFSVLMVSGKSGLCRSIRCCLAAAGCSTEVADGARAALDMVAVGDYGLVVLDPGVRGVDGQTPIDAMRACRPGLPVLLLPRGNDDTRPGRLRPSPDDCAATVLSVTRLMLLEWQGQPDHRVGPRISVGRLVLDLGRLWADVGQGPVALTRLEFMLLKELAENTGRSVSRSQLLTDVWGMGFDPATNVVDTCVHRLRCKLDYDLIRTVRGTGYQLVP